MQNGVKIRIIISAVQLFLSACAMARPASVISIDASHVKYVDINQEIGSESLNNNIPLYGYRVSFSTSNDLVSLFGQGYKLSPQIAIGCNQLGKRSTGPIWPGKIFLRTQGKQPFVAIDNLIDADRIESNDLYIYIRSEFDQSSICTSSTCEINYNLIFNPVNICFWVSGQKYLLIPEGFTTPIYQIDWTIIKDETKRNIKPNSDPRMKLSFSKE